ncbi:hypothetical protein ID866_8893 [Astraeus odoratus]|nr:hypothetical protein ID866_8893 [Astraeus odoratus]
MMDDVIVDTGSSLTWVGADPKNPYAIGPSGRYTGKELTINYHRGKFEGVEYIDSIILETSAGSDALVINAQAVGVAVQVTDFSSLLDGILGLGRKEASALRGADGNPIPTAVDNLYAQGTIKCAAFGVYFIPLNDRGVGEITFGYYNEAVITSGLSYVPITNVPPASNSWGIDGSIAYGGQTILSLMSGVIDTGSMVIGMVIDSALEYLSATGATMDSEGWLTISLEQYNNLQTLSIIIGGQSYDLSPNAQICARATLSSPIKLVVAGAFDSRWGFTLGHPFIQRYYIVFNATGSQIGFASTHNTWSTTN